MAECGGTPRLFRAERIQSCTVLEEPVRLPGNRTLKEVWAELKSDVEGRAGALRVAALVHRDTLDMFSRITAGFLVSVAEPAEGGWPVVELAYPEVRAVHQLLQFGPHVRITGPPEAVAELRDWARRAWLAQSDAEGTPEAPSGISG
ncbi:helix-turn-helix transcriptional regulator [Pseudarthrobacter sp. P1]|uniref:helix-turn-helix transcriptional regulator n=1 Tax=Pseudarthrobacter sp. P1 TaxID=3418418 RepID=UPI003CE85720